MLDDYKMYQKITYKIINNSIKKNRCSHAYLIDSNGYFKSLELAISIAKTFLCPFNYSNSLNCNGCSQCNTIDDGNFLELKIIKPDGEWIKKEQLDDLQNLFSKKAVIGNKKVYIIDGVERLNITSANSILKFLEEPEEGIIAILITENINKVISTIVSRCQILSLNNINLENSSMVYMIANKIFNSENKIDEFVNNEDSVNIINSVIEFVKYYEDNGISTILEIEKLWNCYFSDRKDISNALEIMLLIYKDILNYLMNNPIEIFVDIKNDIRKIAIRRNVFNISKKINIIIDLKEKIKYNINTNLLMDKLLIGFEGCDKFE